MELDEREQRIVRAVVAAVVQKNAQRDEARRRTDAAFAEQLVERTIKLVASEVAAQIGSTDRSTHEVLLGLAKRIDQLEKRSRP